jgi:hypothetical protein
MFRAAYGKGMFVLDLLAENNFGDTRSGSMAGPMGLLIIALLAVATVLLIRNMSARIRRLPDRFPDQDEPADQAEPPEHP